MKSSFLSNEITKKSCYTAVFVAFGIVVPYVAGHAYGLAGTVLLPMHIPILLCGFVLGFGYGGICGLIVPLLSSLFTGMPPSIILPIMTIELVVYGLVGGLLKSTLKLPIWIALPIAMTAGRIFSGFGYALFFAGANHDLTLAFGFVWAAVVTGVAGIVLQLVIIPPILIVLNKQVFKQTRYVFNNRLIKKSKQDISNGKYALSIIKAGKVIRTDTRAGIRALLAIYKEDNLSLAELTLLHSVVVDKVIGKAAAVVCIKGGVHIVCALVISRGAIALLRQHGVLVKYDKVVDNILNKKGDALCPLEQSVVNIDDVDKAYLAILDKVDQLMQANNSDKVSNSDTINNSDNDSNSETA